MGATVLQRVCVCSWRRRSRASMVLWWWRRWLLGWGWGLGLGLLLVVVMCWGGRVPSGLGPSRRRKGAWVGTVSQEAAVGRRWGWTLAPHCLRWERRLSILGRLIGD